MYECLRYKSLLYISLSDEMNVNKIMEDSG